jgi:short-subunit dehydrogenase
VRDRYGPWAVVVGASDGIGAAFADALAERGLDIMLVARRQSLLDDLAERLRAAHGIDTRVLVADVSTPVGVKAVAEASEDVGLLVCNAALAPVAPFLRLTPEQLDAMLDLNCRAAAHLAHGIGTRLVARGRGGVILLSSLASNQGSALVAHYAATKAYLRVLAEGLWAEWRPSGVDVLACCPGLVQTPTFIRGEPSPAGRLVPPPMKPDDVVRAALTALGRQPVVIPGWRNRLAGLLASRVMFRRAVVTLASKQTAAMYPRESRRPAREGGPDA